MSPPGSILGLDFGLRRTGLARTDPDRTLALGLPTFVAAPHRSLREHLRSLFHDDPFAGVVVGLPRHMDGRLAAIAPHVLELGAWIERELGLPVAYWEERLTSFEAGEILRSAPRRVRRDKGRRDQIAAQLILQSFLEAGCPFVSSPKMDER